LNPRYLRNAEAREMIGFAEALFEETDGFVPIGDTHFALLWPEAVRVAGSFERTSSMTPPVRL
jgi:hypothetical protein